MAAKTTSAEVNKMRNFCLNSAKSYIGQNVTLHLANGSVLVNVFFKSIEDGKLAKVISKRGTMLIQLKEINYAQSISSYILEVP